MLQEQKEEYNASLQQALQALSRRSLTKTPDSSTTNQTCCLCKQVGGLRLGSRLDCKTFIFWRNLEWIANYSITPLKDSQQHENISACVCFSGRCCHFLLHRRQVVFCCVVRSRAGITKHDLQRLWRHLLIFCHTFTLLICLDVEQ